MSVCVWAEFGESLEKCAGVCVCGPKWEELKEETATNTTDSLKQKIFNEMFNLRQPQGGKLLFQVYIIFTFINVKLPT